MTDIEKTKGPLPLPTLPAHLTQFEHGFYDAAKKQLFLPLSRLSWVNLVTPRKNDDGTEKYGCEFIFPKNPENIKAIQQAVAAAAKKKFGADNKQWPSMKNMYRVKDGDVTIETFKKSLEDKATLAGGVVDPADLEKIPLQLTGMYHFSINSKDKPGLQNIDGSTITEVSDIYAGAFGLGLATAYGYDGTDKEGKPLKGVTFQLQGVVKVADGEKLSMNASEPVNLNEAFNLTKPLIDGTAQVSDDELVAFINV